MPLRQYASCAKKLRQPIILVFVFLLAGRRRVLGPLASGPVLLGLGWLVTVAIGVLSAALVVAGLVG